MKKEHIILLVVVAVVVAFFVGRAYNAGSLGSTPRRAAAAAPGPTAHAASSGAPQTTAPASKPAAASVPAAAAVSRHPSVGPEDALVTIVEISDFQCPFCKKGKETLEALRKAHPTDVRLVFVHLPLAFHEHARPAAIASLAAHRQGRFWPLYDKLFAGQRDLTQNSIAKMAASVGLDMARFKRDLADSALAEQVDNDTAIAATLGVGGTPAYFINGVQISGAQPKEKMAAVIDAQLKRADELLQQGTPRGKLHLRMWRRNNPAKADAAINWIMRGREPPKSARPKPQEKTKDTKPAEVAKPKEPVHPAKDKTVWKVEIAGDEPTRGNPDALVTLVIFTDFQCPFCSRVRPSLAQVEKTYGTKVRLVFKNQPLSFHKLAPLAAEAGLCAHAQGKFWPMEEQLFTHQRELEPAQLQAHAKAIGLDTKKFAACLAQHQQRPALDRDVHLAAQLQVTGTPTTFVNGRKIPGAQPFGVFSRVIDQELERANKAVAAGASVKKLYASLVAQGKIVAVRPELGATTFSFDFTGSPRLGPANAKIQIAVFEDLQCPFCARLAPILASVRAKLGDEVAVVFKHLPLSNQCNVAMGRDMHPAACHAAFWAMAAQDQDLFWGFAKRVFADMRGLMPDGDQLDVRLAALDTNLRRHAKDAGVDLVKAELYVKQQRFAPTLERDIREAAQLKVSGTPAVFINGREYNGPLAVDRIIAAAKRVLKEADAAPK